MCANEYSFLLLVFVCSYVTLVAEGLPLVRRDRGNQDDLIVGKDFLNVLIDSSALQPPKSETTTRPPKTLPITLPTSIELEHYPAAFTPVLRASRSTRFTSLPKSTIEDASLVPTPPLSDKRRRTRPKSPKRSSDSSDNRLIISVSVSSTVEEAPSNMAPKPRRVSTEARIETTTLNPKRSEELLPSEDHPSLLAGVKKNTFSVDEIDPITSDSDSSSMSYTENLPANVQALPAIKKLSDFQQNSELLKELSQENLKDKLQPYHHTVIYHDNPREPTRARSVSYSTVIQTVPEDGGVKDWDEENESTASPDDDLDKPEPTSNSMAESKDYFVTSKYNPKSDRNWEKSQRSYAASSTRRHFEPTERNWGMSEMSYGVPQKPYGAKHLGSPAYGQPEQNYEVDEAVSVQTSGRTHGVQSSRSESDPKTPKDSKKTVGYVFEGRKERRYRVEERTSDGFIVGEYGVVNHDDGQLRGVRYTADGTISPQLIYNTLMKFLSL